MRINYERKVYMNLKKLVILIALIGIVVGSAFAQNWLETGMYESSNKSAGYIYINWIDTSEIQVRFYDPNLKVIGKDYYGTYSGGSVRVASGAYRFDIIDSRTFKFQGATYRFY